MKYTKKESSNTSRVLLIITGAMVLIVLAVLCVFLWLYLGHKENADVNKPDSADAGIEQSITEEETSIEEKVSENTNGIIDNDWKKAFISEINRLVDENPDKDRQLLFNLVDINGDMIPELISFDSAGEYACISVYKDGHAKTQKLFDNNDKSGGYTDYGAYASVVSSDHQIVKYEYDSTYEKDGGWNRPGSEWLGFDGSAFEYYEHLTVYELNDEKDWAETDKYTIHYHYNATQDLDANDGVGEREFVEAEHNGENITESEFAELEDKKRKNDVYFGSGQDAGIGMTAEAAKELLSDESFEYEAGKVYNEIETEGADFQEIPEKPDEESNETGDKLIVFADKAVRIVSAEASSELDVVSKDNSTYHASNLYDGDTKTAWVEGVDGDGEGESVTLHLDDVHRISNVMIYNGFLSSKRRYAINGRVSKAIIDYCNGYEQEVNLLLMNPPEEETDFGVGELVRTSIAPEKEVYTDTIKITIVESVPGSKYHDTAISEIMILSE